ncbi:MAG: hypothetical protein WCJ58_06225 [bacterium]
MKKASFAPIKALLSENSYLNRLIEPNKFVSQEFQDFGLRLATKLSDNDHRALYIKLAKELPRWIIESAEVFARDYPTKTPNKGRIFMWKLTALCKKHKLKMKFPKKPKPKLIKLKTIAQISMFNGM